MEVDRGFCPEKRRKYMPFHRIKFGGVGSLAYCRYEMEIVCIIVCCVRIFAELYFAER